MKYIESLEEFDFRPVYKEPNAKAIRMWQENPALVGLVYLLVEDILKIFIRE